MKIYGVNPVAEAISANLPIVKVYVADGFKDKRGILKELARLGVKVSRVNRKKLDKIALTPKHQGIVALISPVEPVDVKELFDKTFSQRGFLLIADRIEDPHNLGSLFRLADAFQAVGVVIPKDRSATVSEGTVKASAGAVFHVPFSVVSSLNATLREFKDSGGWLFALERGGKDLRNFKFPFPLALIVGSEGRGVSRSLLKLSDETVEIPMKGHVNSLNVSTAAAIAVYEIFKQTGG